MVMRFSLLIALTVFLADQVSKISLLELVFRPEGVIGAPFPSQRIVEILPFFQLRLAWNPGISFSLFNSGEDVTVVLLIVAQLAIVSWLVWWIRSAETRLMQAALGCIVGGALGNILDRFLYGAVVDFLDFHAAGYHFPTFNLADSAISIGVALWLLDAYLQRPHHGAKPDST